MLLKLVIEIVDFPIKNSGSFYSYVNVYQVGYHTLAFGMPNGALLCRWQRSGKLEVLPKGNVVSLKDSDHGCPLVENHATGKCLVYV